MRFAKVLVVVMTIAGCGDPSSCVTSAHGERYTLGLDGMCLEGATVHALTAGSWQATDAALAWQPAPEGGLEITLSSSSPAHAIELVIPDLDADQMFQQGYQSWSFSGTVAIPLAVPLDDDGRASMRAARTGNVLDEARGVSFHSALLRKGDAGPVLVVAALSAERASTGIAATRDTDGHARLSIIYGPARELLPSSDGQVRSEVLYLATADTPENALAQLSAALVRTHDTVAPKRPPGGWFSWNELFADVDAPAVLAQLDIVEQELLPAGMPLVEIDDGWEIAWGDWRENAKFPDGLPALAAQIRSRGLVAGVWLAPFLVDVTAATAGDPSLFVRDAAGAPIVHTSPGLPSSYYVLDGTNPRAMAIATDHVARLAAGGFSFFKLDFLYAGAFAGKRSQDVTGVEALRAGLHLIRQAAGPDAILNLCGAPILPVIGLGDSLRVGADTAFAGVKPGFMMTGSAARNLAARAYLWPLLWPDADQAQLRAPLTLDEARVAAVAAALAGAPYGLGDDLTRLDANRRAIALDPMVVDLAGAARPATPDGIMVEPTGAIALSPLLENGFVTPPPATFHATGKSGTAYTITFDWMGRTVAIAPQ